MGNFDFIEFKCSANENTNQKANFGNINNHLNWINNIHKQNIFLNGVNNYAEYKTEVKKAFTTFFNDKEKLEHLKRLFNEADMNTKIDIYSSAISLRWAWNFFLTSVVPEPSILCKNETIESDKDRINKNYKLIFKEDTYTVQSFLDLDEGKPQLCCSLKSVRDNLKEEYKSKSCDIAITDYIRNLGNMGAHQTDGLNNTNSAIYTDDNFLKNFLSDLSFEKVALGLEMSAYLLKRFFKDTDDYCYSVDEIPLEGFEIIKSIKAETSNSNNEYSELLPQRYIIGRHKFDDPRIDRAIDSYSIIKEMKIPADKIKDSKYNRKFKLMLERQLYFMSVIGKEKSVHAISPYTGESHFNPYRFLGYSIPTFELEPLSTNSTCYLKRIDELTGIKINEDFYIELAQIFANLEDINDVIIRGVTKENIWVYATSNGQERIFHPVFIGYDLCTFGEQTTNDQQTIDAIAQIQISQNRYNEILSLIPNSTKKIFLASFFVIVFDIYCQSFAERYDTDSENTTVRENMKKQFGTSSMKEDKETCIYTYINEIFSRIDTAVNNHQAGENSIDQNPKISLENLSTAQEIYKFLKDNKQGQNRPESHSSTYEEGHILNEPDAASHGDISKYENEEIMEYDASISNSDISSGNDSPKSEETPNSSTKKKRKPFKLF